MTISRRALPCLVFHLELLSTYSVVADGPRQLTDVYDRTAPMQVGTVGIEICMQPNDDFAAFLCLAVWVSLLIST